ncbi:MAG: hypothetical protein KDE63_11765 [Novosphingobium sp.]|nr:hypothetical protein [Novosphingobium sp.]
MRKITYETYLRLLEVERCRLMETQRNVNTAAVLRTQIEILAPKLDDRALELVWGHAERNAAVPTVFEAISSERLRRRQWRGRTMSGLAVATLIVALLTLWRAW